MKPELNPSPSLTQPGSSSQQLFVTAYGPKTQVTMSFDESTSLTKQSFKDECDINVIMSRYQKTGVIDFVNKHQGDYGDTTGLEFSAMMVEIAAAQTLFHELPSKVRDRFDNDAAQFLEFVHDPASEAEMRELGLMNPTAPTPEIKLPTQGGTPAVASSAVLVPSSAPIGVVTVPAASPPPKAAP